MIYATSPRKKLAGLAWIESVTQAPLDLLWQSVRNSACVSQSEFDRYFEGLEFGTAIHLKRVRSVTNALDLKRLREIWPGFHPPQGFRYLTEAELLALESLQLCADAA